MGANAFTIVNGQSHIDKPAGATLDYPFGLTAYLARLGDTILTATVEVDDASGIVLDSFSFTSTDVVAWISSGVTGRIGIVTCYITTVSTPARIIPFKIYLDIT